MTTQGLPSFKIAVSALPARGRTVRLVADERQRAAIAGFAGLSSVALLAADLTITPWGHGGARVSGTVEARVEQPCAVTLEPVAQTISEPLSVRFAAAGDDGAESDAFELTIDPDEEDAPEALPDGALDLWQCVLEALLLAVDPFPRAPGAAIDSSLTADEPEGERDSPFSVLSRLRNGGGDRGA